MKDFERVKGYSKSEGVIAIGETGLDYHYERREQHRLKQKIWFLWQIRLADKLGLPLILHIRMADEDAIRILRRNKKKLHGGETDGPYVKPERPEEITGKKWTKVRNTSLILPGVAAKIAEIKGIAVEDVLRITEENTRRLFRF